MSNEKIVEQQYEIHEFVKNTKQPMVAWVQGMILDGVSIGEDDAKNGSPKEGDMIAINPSNEKDMWLISKEFFENNYVSAKASEMVGKSLGNTTSNGARKNVKDIVFWGDGDTFKLISKASSQNEGWMKSTKAMQVGNNVIVQVTTQQRNPDGSYAVAEALTETKDAIVIDHFNDDGEIVARTIEPSMLMGLSNKYDISVRPKGVNNTENDPASRKEK